MTYFCRRGALLLWSPLLLLFACVGDDPAPQAPEADAGSAFTAACTTLAENLCGRFEECTAPELFSSLDCVTAARDDCVRGAESPAATIADSDLAACGSRYAELTCAELYALELRCELPPGTKENGQSCVAHTDCKSAFCVYGGESCGTCAVQPAEGAPCINFQCGPVRSCRDEVCITPKTTGASCVESRECSGAYSCVKGVCTAPLDGEGESCDPNGLELPTCNLQRLVYCAPDTNRCTAIAVAANGEPCGLVDGAFVACALTQFCDAAAGSEQGTCRPKRAAGEPCALGEEQCKDGLVCRNGVCSDPGQVSCN